MSETDRLRDLLELAAPDSPDVSAPERAAAVVRRGRAARTRDRVLVGGVAAAVLVVAAAVPALRGGDDHRVAPAPAPPTVAAPCPAAPIDVSSLDPTPDPGEVVAVRSCPTTEAPSEALPTQPLLDADAAAFLEDVEAMPAYQMPPACMVMSIKAEPWALQLQTASGETFVVGDPMRACSAVKVDGTARAVDQVVAAFLGNLDRQLHGVPELACPTGNEPADAATWNASFDPSTAVAGVYCTNVADWRDPGAGWISPALAVDDIATVRDDLAANLTPAPRDDMCIDPADERLLILADADGDQAAYLDQGCAGQFRSARGYWTPAAATRDALTR